MSSALYNFGALHITRFLMKIFWIVPIDPKRVFFSAYEGKQYSCNPKAIYEGMLNNRAFEDYSIVWEINNPDSIKVKEGNLKVQLVKHNSLKYFYEIFHSKYIVTNSGLSARIPLRKSQVNINTWHGGGAFKRVGYAMNEKFRDDSQYLKVSMDQTSYFVSSSRIFSEVMKESLRIDPNKFFPSGMPRNDIFFDPKRMNEVNVRVRKELGIPENNYLVLYAPTYKGSVGKDTTNSIPFNVSRIINVIESKFDKRVSFCVRTHYFNHTDIEVENVLNVTAYPDMQELLVAADMLITDYSSTIWDYALSKKPCILYCPDISQYEADRGFYTNPREWAGMLCTNEDELNRSIIDFYNSAYIKRVDDYLNRCGNYDYGNATSKILELLMPSRKIGNFDNERK